MSSIDDYKDRMTSPVGVVLTNPVTREPIKKALVAYFSATGTTGIVAKGLAKAASADLYEIVPQEPYTNADLDWKDKTSRSSVEMKDASSRPAIGSPKVENMNRYDVIFLGYPVWWYVAPHIINTFLESYDLSGKKIVLFATSGGSRFGKTVEALQASAPGAEIVEGEILNGHVAEGELKDFVERFL